MKSIAEINGFKDDNKPIRPLEPKKPFNYHQYKEMIFELPSEPNIMNYVNIDEYNEAMQSYQEDMELWQKIEACKSYDKRLQQYRKELEKYDYDFGIYMYGVEYPNLLNEYKSSNVEQMSFGLWFEKIKNRPKLGKPNLKSVKEAFYIAFKLSNGVEYKKTINEKEQNELINLLIYWLFNHPKFYKCEILIKEYADLSKGIIIGGLTGTGKTAITKAFCYLINASENFIIKDENGIDVKLTEYINLRIKFIDADYIRKDYDINKNEDDYFDIPLFVNDFCSEYVQDFNKPQIMSKIIETRADRNVLTCGSINFIKSKTKEDILNTFEGRYGSRARSRAKQMFNFVLMNNSKDLRV